MAKVKDCPGFETFGADVKAEPFKLWLAQVGRERIEETIDPEQAIDRALETYQKKGYDTDWICINRSGVLNCSMYFWISSGDRDAKSSSPSPTTRKVPATIS